jgi:hypothetical protein
MARDKKCTRPKLTASKNEVYIHESAPAGAAAEEFPTPMVSDAYTAVLIL